MSVTIVKFAGYGNVRSSGRVQTPTLALIVARERERMAFEPEMAFCDLAGDMDVAEAMLKYVIGYVMDACADELAFLNRFVDKGLLERLRHPRGP